MSNNEGVNNINGFHYALHSISTASWGSLEEGDSLELNLTWVLPSSDDYYALDQGDYESKFSWIQANAPVQMNFDISKRYLKEGWINDTDWDGDWQDVGTASTSYPASAWAPINEDGTILFNDRGYYHRIEDIPEDINFNLEQDEDPRDYIVRVQVRGGDFTPYEEDIYLSGWLGKSTLYDLVTNTEALPQPEDDDLFGGLVFPPEGSLVSYLTTPTEYNRKNANKFRKFDALSDFIAIDSDEFNIDDEIISFKVVKNKRKAKKAAKEDFDFIFAEKKSLLFYNENGDDSGFGEGGLIAIIKGNTKQLSTDNFVIL